MWLKISLFLCECLIFFYQYDFVSSKAMIGEYVKIALPREYTSVVSIMIVNTTVSEREKNHLCTGTLITYRHVLTASHCLEDDLQLNDIEIIVGTKDLRRGQVFRPQWWITYNQWIEKKNLVPEFQINDIAIIKLCTDVQHDIQLSVLSSYKPAQMDGFNIIVVGWGYISPNTISRQMRKGILKVLSKNDCEQKILLLRGSPLAVPDRYICSFAQPYVLTQSGNSGGPIFYKDKIVGVHKSVCPFPDDRFNTNQVNIHTGIDYYRSFIQEVIRSNFSRH